MNEQQNAALENLKVRSEVVEFIISLCMSSEIATKTTVFNRQTAIHLLSSRSIRKLKNDQCVRWRMILKFHCNRAF